MSFNLVPGIPAHMTHARSEWEPADCRIASWVRGGKVYVAPRANLANVDGNAIHYPGSSQNVIRSNTWGRAVGHLRAVQYSYADHRRYSFGYNFAFDERGHVYEARGLDLKCAANFAHNGHIVAFYLILGDEQEPSAAMIDSVRKMIAWVARKCGRSVTIWTPSSGWWVSGHDDLRQYPPLRGKGTPTACCGAPTYRLLRTRPVGDGGLLNPRELAGGGGGGWVGPLEGNYGLYPLDSAKPTIRLGSVGPQVEYVQGVLINERGAKIDVTGTKYGRFNADTDAAVRKFQSDMGIVSDGVVGWDGSGSNPGPNATWPRVDQEASTSKDDPVVPPPTSSVEKVGTGFYFVRAGDSPWAASERIYGKADPDRLTPPQPPSPGFNQPHHWIRTPGLGAYVTKVRAGEGPYSILRRMGVAQTAANLDRFYDMNGGEGRTLHEGDHVTFPDK